MTDDMRPPEASGAAEREDAGGFGGESRVETRIVVARLRPTLRRLRHEATLDSATLAGIQDFAAQVEDRSGLPRGHSQRVAALAEKLGVQLELPLVRLRRLALAAVLHDVGMIEIPESVRIKSQPLTREEFDLVKAHTAIGESILREGDGDEEICAAIRHAHERFDGGGYPDRLGSADIPILARIIGAAEAWDTIVMPRCYKPAVPTSVALEELWRCRGTHFDPEVVDALMDVFAQGGLPLIANTQG